ncbi:MAG: polynucleotide adenylyltransferase PcnB [Gammaproteobacteria bacterium]
MLEQEPGSEPEPHIIPVTDHHLSRGQFSDASRFVVDRLADQGYPAYIVGGGVRDLLIGIPPKDFDVATCARPEQVRRLFRRSRIIGRRFRLVHIYFGSEIVEVATFRSGTPTAGHAHANLELSAAGRLLRDNVYGTEQQDAVRRDFTINALYFDPQSETIRDWVGGYADIRGRVIRLIGVPENRYREDPVRMLRAVRFEAKTGFCIDSETSEPMRHLAPLLATVPPARLFDEITKIFLLGQAQNSFQGLLEHRLLKPLFPWTQEMLVSEKAETVRALIAHALAEADTHIRMGRAPSLVTLVTAFLWAATRQYVEWHEKEGMETLAAMHRALATLMREQQKHVAIPRRILEQVESLIVNQVRLERGVSVPSAARLLTHPDFKASLDFLRLRVESGEAPHTLWTDWQVFSESSPTVEAGDGDPQPSRRPRRPRRRPPRAS